MSAEIGGNGMISQMHGRLELYESEVRDEPWKEPHQQAMACITFENTLRFGVKIFDALIQADEAIRAHVMKLEEPSKDDTEVLEALSSLFDWWLKPCAAVEIELRRFQDLGFCVAFADEFRERNAEAKWMASEASDRFGDGAFVDLRDAAIDELRAE